VKIDLSHGDSVSQSPPETHLERSLETPQEDRQVFCQRMFALGLDDAHRSQRVAPRACRSHVETDQNLTEIAG
jgi:hypothetical protein